MALELSLFYSPRLGASLQALVAARQKCMHKASPVMFQTQGASLRTSYTCSTSLTPSFARSCAHVRPARPSSRLALDAARTLARPLPHLARSL